MSLPEISKPGLSLDGIESDVRSDISPIEARRIESLVESMELTEESTHFRMWGFEFRRVRRCWRSQRRRWVRWVSIISVLAVATAGVLKLLISN